ncbi:BMP family ABC transporter substrate-binding protein [Blautia hansenii]|uniref:Basic membrane protein n=1 Tax=Blautia hansenii DSM 20583 TaxID=537007 RepID=C9LBS7_BLAHA|nr:BMP family ABC transporter substrate-binding protein [Blautia hansenii]ASM68832.1 BMP family ABC transporter substrate-binding protein [Blautia hansenii DSM 20583]EEX20584.1 basic membrane protein [Blautia hansenii DSM 20583]UWO11420.1 BMP family ABC transporter substrate-binding protein [Blautia hansenii DSM 20583]
MKKKILGALLSIAMIGTLFTGCGQQQGEVEKEASKKESADKGGSGFEPVAKEDLKVGVIHIGDPADGSGYSYAHDLGIVEMQKELGLEDNQIIRKNNIPDADPTKTEQAMRECIEEGCQVIYATSFNYMDTCEALAEEYPDVIFSHGTGYKSNNTNFNNYFGRIYQARYLSGIVAGMKTETNKIGYVAAMGSENSEVTGGADAFAIGVAEVNPDAQVYVKVTNSWLSPTEETNAAKALIAEGCDVIGQHCDTPNPQTEAEAAGVWGVGYNSDMEKDAPGATLTSVIWNWGKYYTEATKKVIDGTWTAENYFGGMKEGLVDIAPLNEDLVAPGTQEKVDEARKRIVEEGFNVFDGVLETNDGKTVGEEGKTLDDATITGGINWYYKNIVVK